MEFLKLLKYWLCYKIDDNVLLINFVLPLAASAPVVLNCPFLNLLKRRVEKYNDVLKLKLLLFSACLDHFGIVLKQVK